MANVSAIKLPNGTTYNIKDTISGYTTNTGTVTSVAVSAGTGISVSGSPVTTSGTITVTNSGVTGVKGNAELNYRTGQVNLTAANIGAVGLSGNETILGNKTFSGTTAITPASTFTTTNGVVIPANSTSIIQSPIPKYLWHDIWAFCRATTPKYYISNDGSTWTEATLEKRLFSHQENWGSSTVLDSSIKGSRWEWKNAGFYASMASWLVLGITYRNPSAHFDVLLETSADKTTWTTLTTATNISYTQTPIWIKNSTGTQNSIRLTITWNSNSASNATLGLCSIRFLTHRWGNQGQGSEYEYPYTWDSNYNISPLSGSSFVGNLTGNVTGNVSGTASNVTGTVAIAQGGTGASTAAGARTQLGLTSVTASSWITVDGTDSTKLNINIPESVVKLS